MTTLLGDPSIESLENEIDSMESRLKPLKNFILPGGGPTGATLHLARTVCRRAERELMPLHRSEPVRDCVIRYLNRLGDWLFVAARFQNRKDKAPETIWKAPKV